MFGVRVTPSPPFAPGTATSASPPYLGTAPAAAGVGVGVGAEVTKTPRLDGLRLSPANDAQRAQLELDGQHHAFELRYELAPSAQGLSRWFASVADRSLLVVPHLTPALLAACRKVRLSAADLNGRLYLRAPGLLVELPALGGRHFRFEQEPRNVFVGKSTRIVRALLTDPTRQWRQAELAARAGATSGLVSRIVTHLERQGFLERSGASKRLQSHRLVSPDGLLDAWEQADDFARRTATQVKWKRVSVPWIPQRKDPAGTRAVRAGKLPPCLPREAAHPAAARDARHVVRSAEVPMPKPPPFSAA